MRITIESAKVEVNPELDELIRTKVAKLEHFYENIVDAIVYLHEENDHKELEIKLIVRNDTLFVREHGESFGAALDEAVDTMKRNIKKYKEKTLKNF